MNNSLHPKFDCDESLCGTCAAFEPNNTVKPHVAGMPPPSGWCHRHAPRPGPVALRRWRRDDPEQKGFPVIIERSEDIAFPAVSYYDFCCEWLPRPKGAS